MNGGRHGEDRGRRDGAALGREVRRRWGWEGGEVAAVAGRRRGDTGIRVRFLGVVCISRRQIGLLGPMGRPGELILLSWVGPIRLCREECCRQIKFLSK
jgi:hypothetical protein